MEFLWFMLGLVLGLVLDFFLVLHMLRPLRDRIEWLERQAYRLTLLKRDDDLGVRPPSR